MFWRRKTLKTPKLVRRKRLLLALKALSVVVLLGAVLSGAVYLLNREEILITNVSVSGTKILDDNQLKDFVASHMDGDYLFVIPRSNILLYPKDRIQANVLERFKRVKDVAIRYDGWTGIQVAVEEREPHTQWCGENRLEDVVPACYFLDADGFVYAKAPTFTGDVYFRFYGPLLSGESLGQFFLEPDVYRSLSLFLTSLREVDIKAVDLAVRDEHDYELYLESGTQVIFSRAQDLGAVLENLKSILSSQEFENVLLARVAYIDLRFGNKVFYKYRDRQEEVEKIAGSGERGDVVENE